MQQHLDGILHLGYWDRPPVSRKRSSHPCAWMIEMTRRPCKPPPRAAIGQENKYHNILVEITRRKACAVDGGQVLEIRKGSADVDHGVELTTFAPRRSLQQS